jgi:hypothetical protein
LDQGQGAGVEQPDVGGGGDDQVAGRGHDQHRSWGEFIAVGYLVEVRAEVSFAPSVNRT